MKQIYAIYFARFLLPMDMGMFITSQGRGLRML